MDTQSPRLDRSSPLSDAVEYAKTRQRVSPRAQRKVAWRLFNWYGSSSPRRYLAEVDSAGVIRAFVCEDGSCARFSYELFGDVLSEADSTPDSIASKSSLRYKSYAYDAEIGCYFLGGRLYHPGLGRFLAPDAPEFLDAGSAAGPNPYCYCNNDPVTYTDATGHFAVSTAILIGLGVLTATGIGLTIGGRLSGNEILTNIGDSIISGAEIIGGVFLIVTGIGGTLGMGLLGTGIGSITNGLINQSNGGSYHAGWAGGQLSGALSFIPYFGGGIGAFAGSALTDLIDANYSVSGIDWEKAAYSGLIAFGLSWFGNAVTWGGDELGKAAQFALSYDYALLGISNSIINVFWRGRKKW